MIDIREDDSTLPGFNRLPNCVCPANPVILLEEGMEHELVDLAALGLTKLEYVTTRLYCALISREGLATDGKVNVRAIAHVIETAERLLAVCLDRQLAAIATVRAHKQNGIGGKP
jgi:hypothetical protein